VGKASDISEDDSTSRSEAASVPIEVTPIPKIGGFLGARNRIQVAR